MAIACAGQHAYSLFGDEATLTEEFLSRDFKTWEGGLVSINHENNHEWVKATIHDIEYDSKKKLIICSFSGIPDWLSTLIYSDDYQGLSQECVPIEFRKNSYDVIKGYGTGVTVVTSPYTPAASPDMGVGIRPELAAILASKYPTEDFIMSEKTGGGPSAISTEAYESIALEKVELRSQIQTLEKEKNAISDELASTRKEFSDYKKSEDDRTALSYNKGVADGKAELVAETEKLTAINAFKETHGKEFAEAFLSTNPSIEQIKVLTASKKVEHSKNVGASSSTPVSDEERELAEAEEAWNSSHVRL